MDRKYIYYILQRLGMIDDHDVYCSEEDYRDPAELFEDTCKNLPELMDFVNELFTYNDQTMIKEFLICLLYDDNRNDK